jgi:hypothetical protein
MKQLNRIEPDDIKRLGADQLVRLLNLLLHAEVKTRCIQKHAIHVPFQITVHDGGRDGRWDAAIAEYEYIPRKLTYYQCKAQEMGDADCRKEILRSDKGGDIRLKEKVEEVLSQGGAYVFFSSYPCVNIDDRIAASRKALGDGGRPHPGKDCIEFLDANRIANWVNLHVSAFAYVCQQTANFQAVGLKDIQSWKNDVGLECDFQLNAYLKDQILSLREWLLEPRNVARITGFSGLGKTRLGYEVFSCESVDDNRIRQLLHETVAYVDGQVYGQIVLGWIDQIASLGFTGIIVVDNCPHDWHCNLSSIVRRQNSKLSLLTLDYVPESSNPGILHIELNPHQLRDIVPKILKSVPELAHLQDNEVERVSQFAQGFPQIAILTARAGRALNFNDLNSQNNIADRLLWGRGAPDPQAREYIRCLALFAFVGETGNVKHQLDFVRSDLCSGVSEYDFNRSIRRFKEMRIIQEAGDFIMVTPPPLAVALAAEWLNDAPDDFIVRLLPGIDTNNLTRAFCEQLHKLDFSERAKALSERMIGPNGPLSLAEVLDSEVGSQIFRALAELNPLAATECLYRAFSQFTPEQARGIKAGRRHLIWALEKLCWPAHTFLKAATVLMVFASGETETYANNATHQFEQLFHILLSGTQCPAIDRLEVLMSGLQENHNETKNVCIGALGAALQSQHFSRTSGAEVRGTQLPETDWEPSGYREAWDYWKQAFALLHDEVLKNGSTMNRAMDTIANSLGTFLGTPLVVELEKEFKEIAEMRGGYWPAARKSMTSFLSFSTNIPTVYREAIDRWLSYVQPRNLKDRLIDIVSIPTWEHQQTSSGQYVDIGARRSEDLAEELYKNHQPLDEFIPQLLRGEQNQAWAFGAKCAQLSGDPRSLIEQCLKELYTKDTSGHNPQFLRGVLSATADRNLVAEVLDRVANDDEWRYLLVPLTTAVTPSVHDFDRVAEQIIAGRLPPHEIRAFAMGSVTSGFDDLQFLDRLMKLVSAIPAVCPFVLDVVNMHCLRQPDRFRIYRALLEELLLSFDLLAAGPNSMFAHYWKENTKEILSDNPSEAWICKMTEALVKMSLSERFHLWARDNTQEIVEILLGKYTRIAWPIVCAAFENVEGGSEYRLIKLLTDGGSTFDDHGSPLWALPSTELKSWIEREPELAPFILHFLSLYTVTKDQNGVDAFVWHPHALLLIEMGNTDDVIGCLHANLLSFGSSGSRVPYLEKRIKLVRRLSARHNPKLIHIADTLIGFLEEALREAQKQEAHHAAGIF